MTTAAVEDFPMGTRCTFRHEYGTSTGTVNGAAFEIDGHVYVPLYVGGPKQEILVVHAANITERTKP